MSKNFVQSAALRNGLISMYRIYARSQFWREGPRIFVNSIPKAGTHLLTAELARFKGLQNSRLHLEIAELSAGMERTPQGFQTVDPARLSRRISEVRKGQFFSGHLPWSDGAGAVLASHGISSIFVMRDPRDIVLSRLHYVTGLRRHWLHDTLTSQFDNELDRLRFLVDGCAKDPIVPSLRTILEAFMPWIEQAGVLTVRFEDLVGESGGGSFESKHDTLSRIAEHCRISQSEIDRLAANATGSTPTLRKGKIGGWKTEMPDEIVARINKECGDLLATLGYS